MIQHLKIHNVRVLRECYLTELGQINIICGRNNSGKSTLLLGIGSKEHRNIGITITDDYIEEFIDSYAAGQSYVSNVQYRDTFRAVLWEVFSAKEIWYSNESQTIENQIRENYLAIMCCNSFRIRMGGMLPFMIALFVMNTILFLFHQRGVCNLAVT